MIFLFICHKKHAFGEGFVEGDDGLFATSCELTSQDFANLGFTVELKELPHPSRGHFCGMTYSSDGFCIKDPRRVFQTFGWTHSFINAGHKVMDSLLRAKGLSLRYEMPQCPILRVLADTTVSLTEGVALDYVEDKWGIDWSVVAKTKIAPFNPSGEVRSLFAEVFGVSVEAQLAIEDCIRSCRMDKIPVYLPPTRDVARYAERYVEVG